jgi:hypothetical protein
MTESLMGSQSFERTGRDEINQNQFLL